MACVTFGTVGMGRVEVEMEGDESQVRGSGWSMFRLYWSMGRMGWVKSSVCCGELKLD